MRRKIASLILAILILFSCTVQAFAQEVDMERTGSISVQLVENAGKQPVAGAELSVYYVAAAEQNDKGNLVYSYIEAFADCGIALDDPALAVKLDMFTEKKTVVCQKTTTDSMGRAVFHNLPLGLYFVKQTSAVEGFASCTSFLVTIPVKNGHSYVYDVEATPKTEIYKSSTIVIRKVWNVGEEKNVADYVTVQLLRDGTVLETVILDEKNNWQVTFTDMPESDAYQVAEIDVPEGFTATYTKQGAVFTVINTLELPQTGQLIWPIPVLALSGMLLLIVGVCLLRSRKKYA